MDAWHLRDLRGYGRHPPNPQWPGGARLALQCVLNVEEGAERTLLNGDDGSEDYLPELPGLQRRLGQRHYSAESLFDFTLLRDAFDVLWAEGQDRPGMMSVGLHSRISGHPARAAAVARFLDYAAGHEGVWICRRREIAAHWRGHFGPQGEGDRSPK